MILSELSITDYSMEDVVMRIHSSLILIGCLAFPAAPVAAQTRNVDLTAADGVVLKASYSSPGKPGPGILLFHQCSANGSRRLWDSLANDLVAAGFHVMTFDYRGFGETGGSVPLPPPPRPLPGRAGGRDTAPVISGASGFPPGDGNAALAYLLAQKDVDAARLAVGGSSCGAADAVDMAARRRDIRAVFLLSGLPSLGGRAYMAATPPLAVFGIYAEGDLGAASMRSAIAVSKHPQSTLKMFPGSGHGVELLQQHPDLRAAMVKWLHDQLSQP
jgi:dienelactone hydrolase